MEQFFYSTQIYNDLIILPEDEALHALKLIRKKKGDQVTVVDGKGNLYYTSIDTENIKDSLELLYSKQTQIQRETCDLCLTFVRLIWTHMIFSCVISHPFIPKNESRSK